MRAEATHFAKKDSKKGVSRGNDDQLKIEPSSAAAKRRLDSDSNDESASRAAEGEDEDPEAKRRRLILEEAREIDADSERSESDSSDEYVKGWPHGKASADYAPRMYAYRVVK